LFSIPIKSFCASYLQPFLSFASQLHLTNKPPPVFPSSFPSMSHWFQPYTANKTVTTTYVYVQQVGGQPGRPIPVQPGRPIPVQPGQQVQYVQQGQQAIVPGQQVFQVQQVPQHPGVVMQPMQQNVQHHVGPMLLAQPVHYQQQHMRPVQQPLPQFQVVQQPSPHVNAQQPVNQAYQARPPAQQHYQAAASTPHFHHAYPTTAPSTPRNHYQSVPSTPYMEHAPPAYTPPEPQPTNPPTHTYYHEKLPTQASPGTSVLTSPYNPDEKKKPILPMSVETVYAARIPMPGPSTATYFQKQNSVSAIGKDNQTQQHQHLNKHNSSSIIQKDDQTQLHLSSASKSRNPQIVSTAARNPQTFDDNLTSSSTSSFVSSSAPHVVSTSFRTVQLDTRTDSRYSSALPSSSSTRLNSVPVHNHSTSSAVPTASQQTYKPSVVTQSYSSTSSTTSLSPPPASPAPASATTSSTASAVARHRMAHAERRRREELEDEKLRKQLERAQIIESGARPAMKNSPSFRTFADSRDDTPRLLLIAPTMDEPVVKGPYTPTRILLPCQAPSAADGNEESVHITSHGGYVIMNPSVFLHNNKEAVKLIGTLTAYFLCAASMAGKAQGVPGLALATDAATSIAGTMKANADNRTYLNHTGLDTGSLFEIHLATENHQREALKILLQAAAASDRTKSMTGELRGIVLGNGRTIWVCHECHDRMLRGDPVKDEYQVSLRDYETLINRGKNLEVTLRSSTSLIIFTDALRSSSAQKVSIRIVSDYFEAPERSAVGTLRSYQSLFFELGSSLVKLRPTHLEILANSLRGLLFKDLQSTILKCPSLEQLAIAGMPLFLQGSELHRDIACRSLTKLTLDGTLVDSEDAANNLRALIVANASLTILRVTNASFNAEALELLLSDKAKDMQRSFKKLTQLNLADNQLDVIAATKFSAMAFQSVNLTHIDLSGNSRIGESGGRAILTLLKEKNRRLVEFKTDRTGILEKTRLEIQRYLAKPGSA
ncbi:hypothetical protein EDD21DRAFT_79567, partial [Dissophora ornata]